MKLFKVQTETRHFSFEAYGKTEEEAHAALKKGWEIHQAQTDATMTFEELDADTWTLDIEDGKCYRDGEELK
jgi:hypothetical protein